MTEPTPRRRLAGRLMIAAGALALPLTASISYATSDGPDVPAPPTPPKIEKRVVIIEKSKDGDASDAELKTRVITKDGKTIVFKTDKDLSDEEIQKKVDEAMVAMPEPPEPPAAPEAPAAPGEHRIVIKRIGPEGAPQRMTADVETIDAVGCKDGEASEVNESTDASGHQHRIRIKVCAKEHSQAAAAEALRSAREDVSKDKGIPADVRDKVLKQLDEEIARLSAKQG